MGRLALLGRLGREPAPWLSRLLAPRSSVDRAAVPWTRRGGRCPRADLRGCCFDRGSPLALESAGPVVVKFWSSSGDEERRMMAKRSGPEPACPREVAKDGERWRRVSP